MRDQKIENLTENIGNKAANLVELASILDSSLSLTLNKISVTVPEICPLEHSTVQAHLTKFAPGWKALWDQFKLAQGSEQQNLTEKSAVILEKLRKLIQSTFSKHVFQSDAIRQFLSQSHSNLLMVRSTGKEDAVDNANPGGNESVVAVHTDALSISVAMGKVVASYFSNKSLLQRLAAGQTILDDAFMPVLVQKMINEKTNSADHPIVSGVMYTSEAGIQIQMAPGHGEYIVNSRGPCDTALVTREHVVHTEINLKPQRLVPEGSNLVYQANAPILASNLSIDRELLSEIALVGQRIQAHYGMPMDVEFVFDPVKCVLNLVQARPIAALSSKLVLPSSIAPEKVMFVKEHGEVMKASVIANAGNVAQIITHLDQILLCNTISDALEIFLRNQNAPIKAVVLAEKAPQTSHEAAQFNLMGIPVLHVSQAELNQLKAWVQQDALVLIVDPQRKQVIDWSKNCKQHAAAADELRASGIIKDGLFQSSLSMYESLLPLFEDGAITTQNVPENLKASLGDLIEKSNSADKQVSELAFNALMQRLFKNVGTDVVKGLSLHELFEQLKAEKTRDALQTILTRLYHLANNKNEPEHFHHLYQMVFQRAMINGAEIASALTNSQITPQEWLDAVARLELLVTAPLNPVLHNTSVHQILELKESKAKASQTKGFNQLTEDQQQYFILFFQIGDLIVNEKQKQRWISFSLMACKTMHKCQALSTLLFFLLENGIAADWLNGYFDQKKSISSMGKECYKILEDLKPFQLEVARDKINRWEQRLSEWSDPKKFESLYTAYLADVTTLITSLTLENSAHKAKSLINFLKNKMWGAPVKKNLHPLTQKTVIKLVQDLTELMDKTIKSLKGSPDYREQQVLLVERFYKLLKPYKQLMDQWVGTLPIADFRQKKLMVPAIAERFKSLKNSTDPQQLNPSRRTSIPSITIDSVATFERHFHSQAITLEDLFSLMHQNSLIATTYAGKNSQIKLTQLPDSLQALHEEMAGKAYNGTGTDIIKMNLLSTTLDYPLIHLVYNLPLRNHSAKFQIDFNQKTEKMTLNAMFFGHNELNRMIEIAALVRTEAMFLPVEIIRAPKYNKELSLLEWTWVWDVHSMDSILHNMHALIQSCSNITFNDNAFPLLIGSILTKYEQVNLPQMMPAPLQTLVNELTVDEKIIEINSKTQWLNMRLMNASQNQESIQLSYLLIPEEQGHDRVIFFNLNYNLESNQLDLSVNVVNCDKLSQVMSMFLTVELEAVLLQAEMIAVPHYNEQTEEVSWCWRFNLEQDSAAELAKTLLQGFVYRSRRPTYSSMRLIQHYCERANASIEDVVVRVNHFIGQEKYINERVQQQSEELDLSEEWKHLKSAVAELVPKHNKSNLVQHSMFHSAAAKTDEPKNAPDPTEPRA